MLKILMYSFLSSLQFDCVVHALCMRCMRCVTLRYVAINQFEKRKQCVHGRKAELVTVGARVMVGVGLVRG